MAPNGSPRILIVKLSAIGDVVHTLPALTALRRQLPNAWIGWATQPGPANLLEGHPYIDELVVVPRRPLSNGYTGFRETVRKLHHGKWDVAIDFQGLTKSGAVTWFSGAKKRIGFAGSASRELNRLFMNHRVRPSAETVINMNLQLLEALGVRLDEPSEAVLHVHGEDELCIDRWATESDVRDEQFFVIDPFAGWESKTWPVQNWISLAAMVARDTGLRTLVFFGPGEEQRAAELGASIAGSVLAPASTLRQYVSLLQKHAAFFAGGDTGPMHIAAAAGVPVLAMYGTSDSRRNAPAFAGARYAVLHDLSQPCAGTFSRRCTYHQPGHCMDSLTPEMAAESLRNLRTNLELT